MYSIQAVHLISPSVVCEWTHDFGVDINAVLQPVELKKLEEV